MKTLLVFLLLLPTLAQAKLTKEQELKRLSKCYGLFVRERISPSDSLWKDVESGKKSGTAACMEIFDKARLNSNGEIAKGKDGNYDYEGMRVLNTFLRFHISQFRIPDYSPSTTGNMRFTKDVIDTNEAAYHFLYSLFGKDQRYSDTVTRDFSIVARRYSIKTSRSRSVVSGSLPVFYQGVYKNVTDENGNSKTVPNEDRGGASVFSPVLAETGLLIGLRPDTRNNSIVKDHFDPNYGSYGFDSTNVNQHLGGGVMGAQAYLLGNLGKDGFTNGGTNLFRAWGKSVLEDLLCRGLPALRTKDVVSEVQPESNIAFRTGISCMACHSAMDPLAGAVRNSRAGYSNNTGTDTFKRIKFIGHRPPDMPHAEFPSMNPDSNFHRRPAHARLYYRSYDGQLVREEVVGTHELGQAIAETNDFYVCAAKRYYRFLTGIDVNLSDVGDINTPAFSEGEKFQRDRVIDLGLALKEHQSLRELIKKIIESEAFIYPDRGV